MFFFRCDLTLKRMKSKMSGHKSTKVIPDITVKLPRTVIISWQFRLKKSLFFILIFSKFVFQKSQVHVSIKAHIHLTFKFFYSFTAQSPNTHLNGTQQMTQLSKALPKNLLHLKRRKQRNLLSVFFFQLHACFTFYCRYLIDVCHFRNWNVKRKVQLAIVMNDKETFIFPNLLV